MTLDQQFEEFHSENPDVYLTLVKLARVQKYAKGRSRTSIGLLWELMRADAYHEITKGKTYKFPNALRSRYVRLIVAKEPDLAGMFILRELKAA